MRKFLSANIPCNAGCKYCFAKRNDYISHFDLEFKKENICSDTIILYPCCDGEFFDQTDLIEKVKMISDDYKKVYVSLSTKIYPLPEQLRQLMDLHNWLMSHKKGFVKFAISISTRSLLSEIEARTMSYDKRLSLARIIKSSDLPFSLTIKPVLPFIEEDEYFSILEDFNPYVNCVLLGGLYVDKTSDFYKDYLQEHYICTKRNVCWLSEQPDWDYIEDEKLMDSIKGFSTQLGMKVFTSDMQVVQFLAREI